LDAVAVFNCHAIGSFTERESPQLPHTVRIGLFDLMLRFFPRCTKCGEPLRFVGRLPVIARQPGSQSFECRGCREAVTIAVDCEATMHGFAYRSAA